MLLLLCVCVQIFVFALFVWGALYRYIVQQPTYNRASDKMAMLVNEWIRKDARPSSWRLSRGRDQGPPLLLSAANPYRASNCARAMDQTTWRNRCHLNCPEPAVAVPARIIIKTRRTERSGLYVCMYVC